jgi:hypothetical protein
MKLAHRVAWELANSPIPPGMCVCHHCDNPSCVNPAHLFLGTPADNYADMIAKKRQARGEASGGSKLTPDQVREIMHLHEEEGLGCRRLARRFGVHPNTILDIFNRRTWDWLK